ncbi:hypothetical protein L7F22_049114 [Adiantum nelumboides]|nr:hypothetical protein [Adiantum nelumboides]
MPPSCWTYSPKALAWPWTTGSAKGRAQKHHKSLEVPPISTNNPLHVNVPTTLSAVLPATGKEEDDSKGYNLWLPDAPLVPRPRARYNASSLAYLGDCIYELYVRCHFLSPPQAIDKYNTVVMGLVCCEAQDVFLRLLLKDGFLSEEERDIVRWGKNVQTNHKKATKRAGAAVYSRASSLETLRNAGMRPQMGTGVPETTEYVEQKCPWVSNEVPCKCWREGLLNVTSWLEDLTSSAFGYGTSIAEELEDGDSERFQQHPQGCVFQPKQYHQICVFLIF